MACSRDSEVAAAAAASAWLAAPAVAGSDAAMSDKAASAKLRLQAEGGKKAAQVYKNYEVRLKNRN